MRKEYNKKNIEVIANIWDKKSGSLICPKCGGDMVMVQIEPIHDAENAYVPYDTIIECNKCDYKIRTESFTILGSIRNFDLKNIEIASWSPSGSRVISNYEHVLDFQNLKRIKDSEELAEFLVVNNRVVQIIG